MTATPTSAVIELRQYTLHPGTRDALIELFDREFIESQEALGAEVIGQFRDLGHPDRFVWLRGYADMTARPVMLGAFYGGPVWKAHRTAANATMIDSDNVLLLRPARAGWGIETGDAERPPIGAAEIPEGVITATICRLDAAADDAFLDAFERWAGRAAIGAFVSERAANNFPALPIRENETAFVWFSVEGPSAASLPTAMAARLLEPPQTLRLAPTARSKLRC